MPQLFDARTGAPVTVSPEDAHAGIVSGQYGLDGDAGPVTLVGKDGKNYTAPPEKVASALATGAYRMLSPAEETHAQVAREEAAKGIGGSIVEGARSAANQALLGLPGTIAEETDSPEQAAARAAREGEHTVARTIGGVAGFGASLVGGGGELFKGAELAGEGAERLAMRAALPTGVDAGKAALASRLAGKAANFATQGAIMASPQAFIQAVAGDPKKAAETFLWGLGAGTVLGTGAELLGSAVSGAGEAIASKLKDPETIEWLDHKANEWAARALGAQKSQVQKEGYAKIKSAVDFMYDEGLLKPGMSREGLGDAVKAAGDKWGGKIGDTIDSLDGFMAGKPKPEVLDAALKPGQLGDAIRSNLDTPELRMPMNADQAAAMKMVAESADAIPTIEVNGERVVAFKDAQKFVSSLRSKWVSAINRSSSDGGMKGLETVSALDRMKEGAYQFARDAVHQAADNVATASGEPKLVGALTEAKTAYAKLATLEKFATNLDAMRAGNKFASITDIIALGHGPMAAAGQAAGAAIGSFMGPGGSIAGAQLGKIPGMTLDFFAKKWGEDKGLVILSALAKRAAKEGPEVFSSIMASEGAKRLDATMGGVRDAIRQMAVRTAATPPVSSDHMKHLLGGTTGLTGDQSYAKLGARLNALASDPSAMAAATANASAPFAAGSPELGAAYQDQMRTALQYLHDAMPKPAAPPPPFAPDDWSPPAADKLAFHDKAEIVSNPMRAIEHMKTGTLSDAHLDALRTVYPKILGDIQSEILSYSASHPDVKLPTIERRSVAKILGMPLDAASAHLPALQATFATGGQGQPTQPPGTRAPKGKIRDMPSAASAFTGSQGPSPAGA